MITETKLSFEYAHRFLNHDGEAQYLHGHHGDLVIGVDARKNENFGAAKCVGDIQKIVWNVVRNFDHALLLQETDPLLPVVREVYKTQGILNGDKDNTNIGDKFKNELAESFGECRLIVTKKISTVENLIEIFYSLLKDKLPIKYIALNSKCDVGAKRYF